jgi:hypothetical protein
MDVYNSTKNATQRNANTKPHADTNGNPTGPTRAQQGPKGPTTPEATRPKEEHTHKNTQH